MSGPRVVPPTSTPRSTRNKRKGAKWETAVFNWARDRGLFTTRPRLNGRDDLGDVHLHINDVHTVLECKDVATWSLGTWWNEAEVERRHAVAQHAAVVIRRRGSTDPGAAWAVMPLEELVALLRRAS